MAIKIPPFRRGGGGGGFWAFFYGGGGVEVPILFLWAWGFFRLKDVWEKLNRGVSHFCRERSRFLWPTLSGLFLVGAVNRQRKRKRTNRENPRRVPGQIGKIPGKSGKVPKRTKKEGRVQIGKPPV